VNGVCEAVLRKQRHAGAVAAHLKRTRETGHAAPAQIVDPSGISPPARGQASARTPTSEAA